MSRHGLDLSDCCNYLDSNKKTERRKRIEELKNLLDTPHFVECLNKNSETKTGISWHNVFTSLHQCLLKEAECYCDEQIKSKGKVLPATDKSVRSCCGLLIQVVTKANSGHPLLPCNDLILCILQVCETARTDDLILKSIIGETYINLLNLALSSKKYWGEIDFQTWKDLLNLCLNLVMKVSLEKLKATIISIFNIILLQGGKFSPIIIKSKKLLSSFSAILKEFVSNKYTNMELCFVCVCHTICLQFGKEFRLSICGFIDQSLPFIIALNDNRMSDTSFKEITAHVLIEMVGIRMTDKNWAQEASSLLSFAEKELADLSRHNLPLPALPKIVVLAVKLVKQLHREKTLNKDYDSPSVKKRKVSTIVGGILENITHHYQHPLPWLCYLDYLLEKAPEVLEEEDFLSLFHYFVEAVPSTNDAQHLKLLAKSSVRLLNLCKVKDISTNKKYQQELQAILWATVHRCVGSSILTETGLLLAIDLMPDWTSQDSAKALLDLFIGNKLPITTTSLTAVSHLLSTEVIKLSKDKISLLRWCLSGNQYSADAMFRLLIRTKLSAPGKVFQTELCQTDTELFLNTSSFGLPPALTITSPSEDELAEKVIQEDREACDSFLNHFAERLNGLNSVSDLLRFTTSVCILHGYFHKNNLSSTARIEELLERTLTELLPRLEEEHKSNPIETILPLLELTRTFFTHLPKLKPSENYERIFNLSITLIYLLEKLHKKNLEFQDKPNTLPTAGLQINGKENTKELPEVIIVHTVLKLSESLSDDDKVKLFATVLQLCTNKLTLLCYSGFKIAIEFTKYIVKSSIATALMKDVMKLKMKLLKRWFLYYDEVIELLELLYDTASSLFTNGKNLEIIPEIYTILSSFAKYIFAKKYGPQVIMKYISILVLVIQVDTHSKEFIETNDRKQTPLLHFVEFLNSPFHEVRMNAADYLPMLFSSEMYSKKKTSLENTFNKVLNAIDSLFIVKEGQTPEDVKEEGLNRSHCALKILLGLICSSYVWRRKALYHLFTTISSKKISQTLFSQVHSYLEKSLKLENVVSFLDQNLDYILWSWYNDYKNFQKFPYHFMNYESLPAFLKEYKTIIVTILLENNDLEGFNSFCNVLESTGLEVVKVCFPEMIACLLPKLGGSDLHQADKIHTFILGLIDHASLKKLLSSDIRKVLLAVYMKLNDVYLFKEMFDSSSPQLPSPTPLSIHYSGINAALQYLQKTSPDPELSLLVLLCNRYPSHIQFIMHNLLANVSIATTTEIRFLCFLQYSSLCDSLISELANIKKMAGFLIWHATHALVNLFNSDLAAPACSFFLRFLEKCLVNHAIFIDHLMDTIYPAVSALSEEDSESGCIALRIKDFLVLKKSLLPKILSYLPLEETLANLEEELNIFLKRMTPDISSLERLSAQLMMRRSELNVLYDQVMSSPCSSYDYSNSIIHKLLSKLITIATSSDKKMQNAAARCLGQIGPKNLNTLALQPESINAPLALAEKILTLLLPLIVHRDSEISEVASTAVTELLGTNEGFTALGHLSKIEKLFLIPFLPQTSDNSEFIQRSFNSAHLNWASNIRVFGSSTEGWAVWSGKCHSSWIRSISSRLLAAFDGGVLRLLAPLASKQKEIGEELLPYIVEIIIDLAEIEPEGLRIVQNNLVHFFKKHFELRNLDEKVEEDSLIYVNKKSVQCMINVINFCRLKYASFSEVQRMQKLKLLSVSLLHVAYAAQFCRAYFTSLLYTELWVESIKSELQGESVNPIPLDEVCKNAPEDGKVLLSLLWEDYKELGERDSIEGCVRLKLGDSNARLRYFREMGLWQQLIAEAEVEGDQEALSQGLLMSGLFTCASQLNHSSWEAAWRLGLWDVEGQFSDCDEFSMLHYSALKAAIHCKDKETSLTFLDSARSLVLRDLAHASLEVASSVYLPLAKLQLIFEVESWCRGDVVEHTLLDCDWIHEEPILWQRGLLSSDPQHWLAAARIARSNSSQLIAQRFLQNMKKMNVSKDLMNELKAEEAQVHWNSGNLDMAKYILRTLLDDIDNPLLKAKCLLTYGTWMSETKSEGLKAIIEHYFEKASDLLVSLPDERLGASECLAKFADSEYQRIHRYFNSPEFDMKKAQMDTLRRNLEGFKNQQNPTADEMKSARLHRVNFEVDEAEIKCVNKEYISFLRLAVREYLFSLQFEETTEDKMFRFVSLWLANKDSVLQRELDEWLPRIPSHRFIPVFPQLVVRISPDDIHFSRTLRNLLYRCAQDHPHHCLWHLLALSNAEYDKTPTDSESSTPLPRVRGATFLLNELQKNKSVGHIVQTMQDLAMGYISLANIVLPKNIKISDHKIPKQEKLRLFKDITHISCATMNTPVKKNADYSKIIGITRFDEIYSIAGGINHPKIIKCHCTDGKIRMELVKGNDDPRQDALMQQVFSVLNTLLEGDKETSRRKLSVRTYKVVSLTQKSGVIEWCQDTETIGSYLLHAHGRNRPSDLSQHECRIRLQKVMGQGTAEKLQVFLQICAQFKPVMRHFFFEKFPTPGTWYEKRLAYTRSVATNSMIGYIMGIGDRHVNNILIDKKSAELIHIDFGIAFELGKILPSPEAVPFRLTRDVEDGMGITGTEGVFRRSCEETIKVLRKRSEPILTTLETLLYDPLYSWTVKPRSDQSQQSIPDMSAEETNKLAERFLQRLKLKLEGREEGDVSSVEGQVRNLIRKAKDPYNLCRLFHGWQAYL